MCTTNFIDRVILKLNHTADEIAPLDIVKKIWWFEDGKWDPDGFSNHGNSYLTLTDSDYDDDPLISPLNLFEITVEDTGGEPLLIIDRGFVVQKDISAGGFVASNQGELWLGSGRANQIAMPKIILLNSGASILGGGGYLDMPPVPTGHAGSGSFPPGQPVGTYFLRTDESGQYHNRLYKWDGSNWNDTTPTNTAASQLFRSTDAIFGEDPDTIFESAYDSQTQTWNWSKVGPASDYAGKYFDTIHLIKLDGSAAHLDLGDLTAHGKIGLKSTNNVFAVTAGDNGANQDTYLIPQNPTSGGLGLGTATYPFKWLDATNVFCNVLIKLVGSDAMGVPDGIDVGYGVQGRETNAGKIIYQEWSDALDIVGAGTTGSNRKIKFWAEGGAAFTGNITINKATPVLQLKATSGDPIIEFYDTSTIKMNLAYSAAGDYFYLRDIVGSKDVFQATHAGQLVLPVNGSSGGLRIGDDTYLYRGTTNTLYVYRNIEPGAGSNTGYLGDGGRYWYGLVANYIYFQTAIQFEEYDDLAIAKLWGENDQTLPADYDATKLKPPTDDPFKIIKGSREEANTEAFFDVGKVNSFLMGCVKALAKKQDEHDALLLKLLNEVESLRAEIAA